MALCKIVTHVVQPGDTFYRLAQKYQTTVPEIIMRNPGINPYNLQIDSRLTICDGREQPTLQENELDLNNDMRLGWLQLLYWTYLLQNGILFSLPNEAETEEQLMQAPENIAEVFGKFYPQPVVNQIIRLLGENLNLTKEILTAKRDGESAEQAERDWYRNGENMARLFANANTEYEEAALARQINRYLDTQLRQIEAAGTGAYEESIRLFDENQAVILELADYLTEGLLEQYYRS